LPLQQSVLQVVAAFERASGRPVTREFAPRRAGDQPASWADPSKAKEVLGWSASKTLDDMCLDGWRWVSANPDGFATKEPGSA
jgi:UDP-glucose 4-epimerase